MPPHKDIATPEPLHPTPSTAPNRHWYPSAGRAQQPIDAQPQMIEPLYGVPPVFGDSATADEYRRVLEEFVRNQTSELAVVPRAFLESPRGRLEQGAEVLLREDLGNNAILLQRLVRAGCISQIEPAVAERNRRRLTSTSTWVVRLMDRTQCRARGIEYVRDLRGARDGDPIDGPSHFATPARPAVTPRPAEYIRESNLHIPPIPASPAVPANDGRAEFDRHVREGRIVRRNPSPPPEAA